MEFSIAAGNKRGACRLHETRAEGRGILLVWLCIVAGGYPGPQQIGHLILKRKPISHGYVEDLFALLRMGTRRSLVEHAKPSAIHPQLVTTSNIFLSRAYSLALSGFKQLAWMELSRAVLSRIGICAVGVDQLIERSC